MTTCTLRETNPVTSEMLIFAQLVTGETLKIVLRANFLILAPATWIHFEFYNALNQVLDNQHLDDVVA